jgi:O-antigen/teichoic acid export membrane protein
MTLPGSPGVAVPSSDAGPGASAFGAGDARRITRNSLYLVAGQALGRAIGFVYLLALASFLDVADFGLYNLVLGMLAIAMTASDFGLARLVVRDLARDEHQIPAYLATLLPLRAMLAIAGYVALLAGAWIIGYPGRTLLLTAIAAVALLPTTLGLLFDTLFHARQQMHRSWLGDVVLALTQVATGAVVLVAGGSLEMLLATNIVAACAYFAFLTRQAYVSGYRYRPRFDRALGMDLMRRSAPYALVTLLAALAARAELLLLGVLSTGEDLGLFSAALKFPETCLLLPAVLVASATPVISQCHSASPERLREVYGWLMRRVLAVTLPIALAGVLLAHAILDLLFPPAYAQATPVMQVLFAAFPLATLQLVNSAVFMMSDRSRVMLAMACTSAALQFALGAILIARWGMMGGAVSALLSHALGFAISYGCLRRWFFARPGTPALGEARP